jgi:hypothetical protein
MGRARELLPKQESVNPSLACRSDNDGASERQTKERYMKHVKMLGLAAIAAMALVAFVGASSASATALCKTNNTPCPVEWHYPIGTEFHASLDPETTAILKTTGGAIENTCNTSTVKGTTETTGGSTETVGISVPLNGLVFGGCTNTTDVLEGGTLEIHHIAGTMNGTLTAKNFRVTILLGGVTCVYGAGTATDLGTVTGGTMATVDVNGVVNKVEGSFLCPPTAIWEAKYTVTSPEPLYVSES